MPANVASMRLFPAPRLGARLIDACPVCSSGRTEYEFTASSGHVARCVDCSMLFLRESPPLGGVGVPDARRIQRIVTGISARQRPSGPILVVAPAAVPLDGFAVVTPDALSRVAVGDYRDVVCVDVLDRVEDPHDFLDQLRACVAPQARLSFAVPSIDSASARYAGPQWWGFHSGAARFFGIDTLQNLLVQHGFRDPLTFLDAPLHRGSLRVRLAGRVLRIFGIGVLASKLQRPLRLIDDSVTMTCRPGSVIERHKVSVVVPIFNEAKTMDDLLKRLLAKTIPDMDMEVIIVESNSTDGSRERALRYRDLPGVSVILQETPRGKGNAVREGLRYATGDIVLFQDADLEYEVEDYDDLLRPICAYQRNFVIGSRHAQGQGVWKIRDFNGAPLLSQVFNFGHVVFLALLNGMYGQRLVDPFSMFKVFRRDCLAGLSFECDRFDFDFEIVIKLLRKGYKPLEIPVNYHSRSIAEGKKVTMLRDPLTWLRALLRFRTCLLYPERNHRR